MMCPATCRCHGHGAGLTCEALLGGLPFVNELVITLYYDDPGVGLYFMCVLLRPPALPGPPVGPHRSRLSRMQAVIGGLAVHLGADFQLAQPGLPACRPLCRHTRPPSDLRCVHRYVGQGGGLGAAGLPEAAAGHTTTLGPPACVSACPPACPPAPSGGKAEYLTNATGGCR